MGFMRKLIGMMWNLRLSKENCGIFLELILQVHHLKIIQGWAIVILWSLVVDTVVVITLNTLTYR